jgi:hypothetical protein
MAASSFQRAAVLFAFLRLLGGFSPVKRRPRALELGQLITGLVDSLVAISPSLDHTSTRLFRLFFRGRMCGAQTVEAKRDNQIKKLDCVRANSRDSSQLLPLKQNPSIIVTCIGGPRSHCLHFRVYIYRDSDEHDGRLIS